MASVTHISYLLKLYTRVDLMCHALKSTQSSVPSHPFPPLGHRQGPSIPISGQRILADLPNTTSEVPSPWLKEVISVLLCVGDH